MTTPTPEELVELAGQLCPACCEPLVIFRDGRPDDLIRCGCTVVSVEWLEIAAALRARASQENSRG